MASPRVISKYFREVREASGMSQLELATKLGYRSSQMVSNWERGLCDPPLNAIYKMIRYFDLDQVKVLEMVMVESNKRFLTDFRRAGVRRRKTVTA